jgi:hypothetical protein
MGEAGGRDEVVSVAVQMDNWLHHGLRTAHFLHHGHQAWQGQHRRRLHLVPTDDVAAAQAPESVFVLTLVTVPLLHPISTLLYRFLQGNSAENGMQAARPREELALHFTQHDEWATEAARSGMC